MPPEDHELAGLLAQQTADLLLEVRDRCRAEQQSSWQTELMGDRAAHELLVARLAEARPDDIVLSEEGADDPRRLDSDRVWIVDPLDGTADFGTLGSDEFAVHVALVVDSQAAAAAVSLPARKRLYGTLVTPAREPQPRQAPVVLSGRGGTHAARAVARALGGEWAVAGSAGVKAMAVVDGEADLYVHPTGLWEWDVCAPAAVARAHGLHVSALDGSELVFNQGRPVVNGLLICRREYATAALHVTR